MNYNIISNAIVNTSRVLDKPFQMLRGVNNIPIAIEDIEGLSSEGVEKRMKSDLLQKIKEKHQPNSCVEIRFVISAHGKHRSTVINNGRAGDKRKRYDVMNLVNPISNIMKDLSETKDTFCN